MAEIIDINRKAIALDKNEAKKLRTVFEYVLHRYKCHGESKGIENLKSLRIGKEFVVYFQDLLAKF